MFPIGTENLLAKHLLITSNADQTAQTISDGCCVRIDAGRANGKLFLVLASCGLDADVVNRLHAVRQGNINRFSYTWPLLQAISNYRYPKLNVTCDGLQTSCRWAFVFNVPQYALQLPIVDDATCIDGQLDLCTFRQGNLLSGLLYFWGVVTRQHRSWKDTQVISGKRILIESDEPVPFQLDGDPGGHLPLEIEVLPGRLKMIVGQRWLTHQQIRHAGEIAG